MPDPSSRFAAFIAELRHRRVFRVAAVYACIAFIIFQIVDATFEPLNLPDWASTLVVVLLALGFPVAVGMAWAFDLTAEGLVRAKVKREPTAAKAPHHIVIGNKTLVVIAAVAVAVAVWSYLSKGEGPGPITSIAVLPLDNIGGDPEQEYFVEGMHDALISALSNIGAVTVISRRSTLQYKDSEKTMPTIASELGVDALLEGSAYQQGERVLITTQLIDSKDRHLWSNTYERNLEDVFALFNDVTLAIAQEIQAKLTPDEETRLAGAPQVSPEAYRLYLKGWHFNALQSREDMPKAVEYLEQAVALDPTFALAWVALAESYVMGRAASGWSLDSTFNLMKQAYDKALELDANLPEAHAGLGWYQEAAQYDFAGAEASFRRALELDPDNAYVRITYGGFLSRTGRPNEALVELRRAHDLDPLAPQILEEIAQVYAFTRQYDKAMENHQATLELAPNRYFAKVLIASAKIEILMQQGRYEEVAEQRGVNTLLGMRARMAMGNVEEVYAIRDSLRSTGEWQQYEQEYPFWFARFYAIMGEQERSLSLLEGIVEEKKLIDDFHARLLYASDFDPLRAEPRFKALLQKIGLREVFDQYGQRIR